MSANRVGTVRRVHFILHRCLVHARNLALSGNCRALYELADTFEIVPLLLESESNDDLVRIRDILADYQTRHADTAQDYLAILDMTDADFDSLCQPWPEAALDTNWTESGD